MQEDSQHTDSVFLVLMNKDLRRGESLAMDIRPLSDKKSKIVAANAALKKEGLEDFVGIGITFK